MVVGAALRNPIRFLAVDELFGNSAIFDRLLDWVGVIPISRSRVPIRTLRIALARLEVQRARTMLSKTQLVAPSDGLILHVQGEPGQLTGPKQHTALITMTNLDEVRVRAWQNLAPEGSAFDMPGDFRRTSSSAPHWEWATASRATSPSPAFRF